MCNYLLGKYKSYYVKFIRKKFDECFSLLENCQGLCGFE